MDQVDLVLAAETVRVVLHEGTKDVPNEISMGDLRMVIGRETTSDDMKIGLAMTMSGEEDEGMRTANVGQARQKTNRTIRSFS